MKMKRKSKLVIFSGFFRKKKRGGGLSFLGKGRRSTAAPLAPWAKPRSRRKKKPGLLSGWGRRKEMGTLVAAVSGSQRRGKSMFDRLGEIEQPTERGQRKSRYSPGLAGFFGLFEPRTDDHPFRYERDDDDDYR
jgi:hypothetical protein